MKRDGNTARSNDLGGPIRLCSRTSFTLPLLLLLVGPLANIGAGQAPPSDDTYITSSKTAGNYGTSASLAVQAPGTSSLIRFDLSGIPAGYTSANVAKASLKLYVSAVTANGSFNVDLEAQLLNVNDLGFSWFSTTSLLDNRRLHSQRGCW